MVVAAKCDQDGWYELRSGGDLLATLRFRSMFGTFARAESEDGCWTFKRMGFWQNRASIRACGSVTDLAMFTNNTWDGGGTLVFSDGHRVQASTNFWMTNFEFRTVTDDPLVTFDYGGVFHRSAQVRVSPRARPAAESSLLVLFGWYWSSCWIRITVQGPSSPPCDAAAVSPLRSGESFFISSKSSGRTRTRASSKCTGFCGTTLLKAKGVCGLFCLVISWQIVKNAL